MLSLKNLLISVFSPAVIFIAAILTDLIFKTGLSSAPILLVYLQHIYLGEKLGVNLYRGGGWISFPYNGTFLLFNILLDYFFVALVIYVLLTALTKCFFRSKFV